MKILDVIELNKVHLDRLSNQSGSNGEALAVEKYDDMIPRPRGKKLSNLLDVLAETGIEIKKTSFDALACPDGLDLGNLESIRNLIDQIVFIEIKTTKRKNVTDNFTGYYFGLTESEIDASKVLGDRHKVLLFNLNNRNTLFTSVPEILDRAKSQTWQVSVQI
ncbi:hypothetical protein AB4508_07595 [Vibrio splendidus]